ncbi:MAG: DUF2341 domain-containing protein [Myxococcales bacterium]|nr:DUF2341 domain-containing protein [Myxococcales bacterium]
MRFVVFALVAVGCGFQASPPKVVADGAVGDGAVDAPDAPPDLQRIDGVVGSAYKKVFTTDPTKVAGDLTDFPVWVKLAADNDLALHADLGDIYFTLANGTPLEWQLQRWNKATGDLEAWVRLDLADTTPTTWEIRYGDPGPVHASNALLTFSSSFAAVWHMEDALGGATTVADALGQRMGVAVGGPTSTAGKLGRGIAFDGNDDRVTFTNPLSGNTASTISAWVDVIAPINGFSSVMTVGNPAAGQSRFLHTKYPNLAVGLYGNDLQTQTNLDNVGPKLVTWVYDPNGMNGVTTLYVDGVQVATHNHGGTVNTTGTMGFLAYALQAFGPGGNTPNPLRGTLDEVRIATTDRSRQWVETEFANQSDPLTFATVSAELPLP